MTIDECKECLGAGEYHVNGEPQDCYACKPHEAAKKPDNIALLDALKTRRTELHGEFTNDMAWAWERAVEVVECHAATNQSPTPALVQKLVDVLDVAKQPQGGAYGERWLRYKKEALAEANAYLKQQDSCDFPSLRIATKQAEEKLTALRSVTVDKAGQQEGKASEGVGGCYSPEHIEAYLFGGKKIDHIVDGMTYNLTGTHLKDILQNYRNLWDAQQGKRAEGESNGEDIRAGYAMGFEAGVASVQNGGE